jgi:hypothetical protein
MATSSIGLLTIAAIFGWVVLGVVWLLPKKLALVKRVGPRATNDDLVRLAKAGDTEAQELRKLTWYYMGLGVFLAVVLVLVGVLGRTS